jgi:hypothetical protein
MSDDRPDTKNIWITPNCSLHDLNQIEGDRREIQRLKEKLKQKLSDDERRATEENLKFFKDEMRKGLDKCGLSSAEEADKLRKGWRPGEPISYPAPDRDRPPKDDPPGASLSLAEPESDNASESTLLKPVEDLTEGEVHRAMASDAYWNAGDPDRPAVLEKVAAWHDHVYGTAPQKRDATGRGVEPVAKNPPPETVRPLRTPQGETVAAALTKLGAVLNQAAAGGLGPARAVKGLQRGLTLTAKAGETRLKIDGDLGPKTKAATRRALATKGRGVVGEGLALGTLSEAAADPSNPGTALTAATKTVAPLYAEEEPRGGRIAGLAVQTGLNAMGGKTLKEDGDIGPKTRSAFADLARANDPDRIAQGIGRAVGWLED